MLKLSTECQVVKATGEEREIAEDGGAAKRSKVARNYCEDGDRWV